MDDTIKGRTLRFLYEKAQQGELYAGFVPQHPIGHECAPDKLYNVFDIIDGLARTSNQDDELVKYNVMYLRKMVIEKIVDDFESWFSKSGIPLQDWEKHLLTYAKNYMGMPNW
jgi:hypothetical protein